MLKYSVPEYIRNENDLMKMINRIENADIQDGGSGGFLYLFKKKIIK